ncbi:ABC transporter ATP-binding protein [Fusibacter bizertensis]|uniref:ABC transporter ATP-binding protein n=1 Tax=Fusibacter bizertensis TaxID=1488331 RepID=A0ABT6NGR6_9FIRM|nr:ABC transporter ATP-binding protein [Fusibacter bizertensis]MDH8679606.1 ABC transporter ATP-binding protein [Fusibacter bizertensis]
MKELLFKRKKAFAVYVLACFFPVIGQLLGNLGFANLIGVVEKANMRDFYIAVLGIVAIVIISSLLQLSSRFLRIRFMRDTLLDIRKQAFDKILNYSYAHFSKKSKEVYISNLVNDINNFEQIFFHRLLNVIFNSGVYFTSLILLAFFDWQFAIAIFVVSLVVFLITKGFEGKTVSLQENVSTLNEEFTIKASNTFNGLEILKLNSIEDKFLLQTMKSIDKVEQKRFFFTLFTEGQRGLTNILRYLIFIGILMYLLLQAFGGLSIAKLTFMLQLATGCVWPIGQVMPMFNELKAAIRIYEKITVNDEPERDINQNLTPYVFKQSIVAKGLSFAYDNQPILNNASFNLIKGKKYLLKGASGAGKSTLIKLLSKIYENYQGEIYLDDENYHHVSSEAFNNNVSYIYQDVFLFEDTLLNNITLYSDYSSEIIDDAIKRSGLEELLLEKEEGLNFKIQENGKNLSGGQRQRISIARAIIKQTDILFADEATSSLNEQLGREVEETILSLKSTVIAISHRYYEGITEKYDYVLELKNGLLQEYPSEVYFKEVVTL